MEEDGLYNRMVLEDLDLGVAVPATQDGTVNHYSFSMNGQNVRTFRWVMKSRNGKTPKVRKLKPAKAKFTGNAVDDPMEQVPMPGKKDG
jgi:hypothetical protein